MNSEDKKPRLTKNGKPDKRSQSSGKNCEKARDKLSCYIKKAREIREESGSETELVITRKEPRRKQVVQHSESESENDVPTKPCPVVEPVPSRDHASEIDDLRAQLRTLHESIDKKPERDPVVHALRQQLIASALRF
jgi:hypothetical protein